MTALLPLRLWFPEIIYQVGRKEASMRPAKNKRNQGNQFITANPNSSIIFNSKTFSSKCIHQDIQGQRAHNIANFFDKIAPFALKEPIPHDPSLLFLSVTEDNNFLPSRHYSQGSRTLCSIATNAPVSAYTPASADPFHADWPHWDDPVPEWLLRC